MPAEPAARTRRHFIAYLLECRRFRAVESGDCAVQRVRRRTRKRPAAESAWPDATAEKGRRA